MTYATAGVYAHIQRCKQATTQILGDAATFIERNLGQFGADASDVTHIRCNETFRESAEDEISVLLWEYGASKLPQGIPDSSADLVWELYEKWRRKQ